MTKTFLCVLLIGATVATGAAADTTSTVVDIPNHGALQRILYVHPDAPAANIVVLPGGDGYSYINGDGSIFLTQGGCGPVHRNRQAFADLGYAVAIVQQATDDIEGVVDYLQQRDKVPTWIVGGSSSTPIAASATVKLPAASPVGVIFFSSDVIDPSLAAMVKRPSLVVFSPLDDGQNATAFYNQLTSAPIRTIVPIPGGNNNNKACPGVHVFWGADQAFIDTTTAFIAQNNTFAPSVVQTIEFYNASLDHYFITWVAQEISDLDTGVHKGWARTGYSFNTYTSAQAGTSPVCRFYIPPALGDSHFFGRGTAECDATGQKNPTFVNEDPAFMQLFLPVAGACPAGTIEIYRVFSNRLDANHRYMTDKTVRDAMQVKGWLAEGDGPNLVVMCSPQ